MPPVRGASLESTVAIAEAQVADLAARHAAAVAHLDELRAELRPGERRDPETQSPSAGWSAARRVGLFRSLFHGREDVFAVRWENQRKGRAGYAPRCANEWRAGVCEKPRVRCGACPNQAFVRVGDSELLDHLRGRTVLGIYPLLADDTCWLLAIDLDGDSWPADVAALRAACEELDLAPAVERSRSGDGAHVWLFFSQPVPAVDARALGTLLLTSAMARSPTLTMDSYDRLFPSQDTLPAGGFGNLIALPLQFAAREHGNTVFLDEHLEPYRDQWAFLASVPRIGSERLQRVLAGAGRAGEVLGVAEQDPSARRPWRSARPLCERLAGSDLPQSVHATLAQRLYVERDGMPPALLDAVRRLAAFANPLFGERQAMRLSTGLTPRVIACFEDLPQHVALPRGCVQSLRALLGELGASLELADERSAGAPIEAVFTGTLTDAQERAVADVRSHDSGVLCGSPGAGKTVIAARLIAARGRSTLVLVHRKPLVEQWLARLREFLDVDGSAIGTIGGGRRNPSGVIDVAMVQSLARSTLDPAALGGYGHVVVDECHHVPAVSVEGVLASCPARYVTGLTATPYRRDGHQPIIAMQCGPLQHTIDGQRDERLELRVIRRETSFDPAVLPTEPGIQEIYSALATDPERIELVARDVRELVDEGRAPLVLTERREHLDRLAQRLRRCAPALVELHGDVTPRRRRDALARLAELPPGAPRVVLATGRFIGEGFDDPRLDTLLLTMPIAWKGTVVQYAGRLHRPHPGKREARIYDYVDADVPVLRRMFAKRAKAYRTMAYTIADH